MLGTDNQYLKTYDKLRKDTENTYNCQFVLNILNI